MRPDEAWRDLGGERVGDRYALVDAFLHGSGQRLAETLAATELGAMRQGSELQTSALDQSEADAVEAEAAGKLAAQRACGLIERLPSEQRQLQLQQAVSGARSGHASGLLQGHKQGHGRLFDFAEQYLIGFCRPGLDGDSEDAECALSVHQRQGNDAPGFATGAAADRWRKYERLSASGNHPRRRQQRNTGCIADRPTRSFLLRPTGSQQNERRLDARVTLAVAVQPALRRVGLSCGFAHSGGICHYTMDRKKGPSPANPRR